MALGSGVNLPTITQRIVVDDSAFAGLGRRIGGIGKMLGTAVAGGAVVAAAGIGTFVAAGVKGAIEVEKGISEVVTLFGVTGDEAERLGDRLSAGVADLSGEVGIAQDVLTGGLYDAISAGIPEENVFDFMRTASQASIAGVTDVGTAVDGLTTTINAFGLDASQAGAVADSMFAAVQGGKTTFEELSSALFQVAPSAAAAGISFEEVNAGIATLTSQGTPTAVATTRMRAAIDELAKPGTKVGEVFEKVAGVSFRDFIAQGGSLTEALGVLQGHAEETGAKIGDYFGSVEAAGAATSIAATGADKMAQELARQEDAAGAATDAYDTMNQTTSRAIESLKVSLTNAAVQVGSEVLPKLNEVVRWATERLPGAIATTRRVIETIVETARTVAEAVGTMAATVTRHWDTIRRTALIVGGVILAVFGPGWIATMGAAAAASVTSSLTTARSWLMTQGAAIKAAAVHSAQVVRQIASWVLLGVQSLLHAAKVAAAWLIAMGPIALVVAAVVALVVLIVKNWDTIVRVTRELWSKVTDWFVRMKDAVVGAIRRAVDWVKSNWPALLAILTGPIGLAVLFIARKRDEIIGFFRTLPARIKSGLGNLLGLLKQAGRDLITGLMNGVSAMASRLKDAVLEPIKGAVGAVKEFLRIGSPSKLFRQYGSWTAEGLAQGLERGAGQVASAGSRLASAVAAPFPSGVGVPAVAGAGAAGAASRIEDHRVIHVRSIDPHATARAISDELSWQTLAGR